MFKRAQFNTLERRLSDKRRYIQVMIGPRQVGKSTIAHQLEKELTIPTHSASGDAAYNVAQTWIHQQWTIARHLAQEKGASLLILDEVQKISDWSSVVKQLWDEDTKNQTNLKVLLLGSSSLMLQTGLTESLAGRFEMTHVPHWEFLECQEAFGLTADEFIFFGGYPGALPLKDDWQRFKNYIKDSLIETVIAKDILMMTTVKKPALLRRVFDIGCIYSSQILSYQKMIGQLQEAGNITTLEHYLKLLGQAGLLTSIDKFAVGKIRQRASSPKLMPLDPSLFSVCIGKALSEVQSDHALWGRFVETAVGTHLLNTCEKDEVEVFYWREGNFEVDFILKKNDTLIPIEVKSAHKNFTLNGMDKFASKFPCLQTLLVGGQGLSLETFLSKPAGYWFTI